MKGCYYIQTIVSGIHEISKEVPVGAKGPFYPIFAPVAAFSMHFFVVETLHVGYI